MDDSVPCEHRDEHTDFKQTHAVVVPFITVSFMNLSTPIELMKQKN
jgi:hypothetical protein